VTVISKIKAVRRGGLAIAVLVAALMVPAQAAMAGEDCSQTRTDPTAAQYCSVAGTHASGENGNKPNDAAKNGVEGVQSGSESSPGTEATVTPAPAPASVEAVEGTTAEESGGSLPFTGLDVGILALVAIGLAGTGLLLRRLTGSGAVRN
jgi:hypothetical protein